MSFFSENCIDGCDPPECCNLDGFVFANAKTGQCPQTLKKIVVILRFFFSFSLEDPTIILN